MNKYCNTFKRGSCRTGVMENGKRCGIERKGWVIGSFVCTQSCISFNPEQVSGSYKHSPPPKGQLWIKEAADF